MNMLLPVNICTCWMSLSLDDVNNLADKLQSISTEIYAMQDEQRYTTEKQHNYREGIYLLRSTYE